jgi:hypothetical protein
MICKICPTCNRKFPTPKVADKKLAQDIARAQAAILVLHSFPADSEHLREACQLEAIRLEQAVLDHGLLWSIYRRSDKASGYGMAIVKKLAA